MIIVTGNPCLGTSWIRDRFFSAADKQETRVEELLEIWRDILQNQFPDAEVDINIEYTTVDGTTHEYDDRGLDFDILSNTKE